MAKVPDGGTGGDGGSVYFKANSCVNSLHDLRRAHFKGNHGKHAKGKQRHGADGSDKTYNVPVGTEIYLVENSIRKQ